MHSLQGARPHRLVVAAVAALLLAGTSSRAVSQSESPPSLTPPNRSAGPSAEVARQTALAIAGATSMVVPPPGAAPAAQPPSAGPGQTSAREMTADQRREFMMLLILRETSRNPIGSLR
jgi:hypothetical protein